MDSNECFTLKINNKIGYSDGCVVDSEKTVKNSELEFYRLPIASYKVNKKKLKKYCHDQHQAVKMINVINFLSIFQLINDFFLIFI